MSGGFYPSHIELLLYDLPSPVNDLLIAKYLRAVMNKTPKRPDVMMFPKSIEAAMATKIGVIVLSCKKRGLMQFGFGAKLLSWNKMMIATDCNIPIISSLRLPFLCLFI